MSEEQVRTEVCEVFASPMGLLDLDKKSGFSFHFLQKTGAGSKSFCIPAVKENWEWTGQKVASLSKSGGFIYLLANEPIPGWIKMVC